MEEMVSDVNFEKWIVFRCREEGIIIITPIYWQEKIPPCNHFFHKYIQYIITLESFLVPVSEQHPTALLSRQPLI